MSDDKILIPYNDKTRYIYEGFAKIALEVAEKRRSERMAAESNATQTMTQAPNE